MRETQTTRRTVLLLGVAMLTVAVGSVAFGGTVTAQDATNETLTVNATLQNDGSVVANGTTNATAANTTVSAAVIDGPSTDAYENATTEDVGADGRWNLTLPASETPAAGTYVLEAATNDTNATAEFDVPTDFGGANATTAENGTATASPTGTETATASGSANETTTEAGAENETSTDTDEMTATQTADGTPADDGEDAETGETDGQDGPGFGVVAALLGVVGTVVLARRY